MLLIVKSNPPNQNVNVTSINTINDINIASWYIFIFQLAPIFSHVNTVSPILKVIILESSFTFISDNI